MHVEENGKEKKVDYIELFFDLIFVYTFRTVNALITHGEHFPSLKDFALFFYLVLVALQIWFYTTMYFNRFGKRSLLDYLSLILNMYFLFFMGTSMEHVILEHYTRYHIALALILFNLSHLNFRRSKECKDCLDVTVLQANALDFFLQGILVVITIPIHYFWGLILSPLAMVFGYCSRIFEHRFFSGKSVDFSHLSERALLLVILTFGESIIAISEYFHYGGKFFFNITSFLITVVLFMHYAFFYDNILFHKKKSSGQFYLLIHVFFILCLNTLTIAFELFIKEAPLAHRSSVIFTLALCGVYLSLMALSYYAKPEYKSIPGPMLGIGLLIMTVYLAFDIFFAGNRVIVGEITTAYVFLNIFLNIYLYLKKSGRKPVFGHEIS